MAGVTYGEARRVARLAGGVHIAALAAAGWLVGARPLFRTVWDHAGERGAILFQLLALPATVFVGLVALAWWFWAHRRGVPRAGTPLLVLGTGLLVFLLVPFGPLVDRVDFFVHERSRTDIVRLIESGALGQRCPDCDDVDVPRPYPSSVSNGGGQRGLSVWVEGGVTTVVFSPSGEGFGNLLHGGAAFVYRSDDRPPALPHPRLLHATDIQKLRDHWYRVTFPAPALQRR